MPINNLLQYRLKISAPKSETIAFRDNCLVRTKVDIEEYILDLVSSFNYLVCNIFSNYGNHVNRKVTEFRNTRGTVDERLGKRI